MDDRILESIISLCSKKFTFGKYRYYIFNRPNEKFSSEQKECLFDFTARMIQETFEKEDQSYFKARANYFGEITQYWLVLDKRREPIGFCGIKQFSCQNRSAIYFDTVNISRRYQANGIASIIVCLSWLVNSMITRSFVPFAMRTQNPTVYKSIIRMVEPNVLPEIDYRCEPEIRGRIFGFANHVAGMLSKKNPGTYDEKTSVCRAAYGRSLYGENFRFSHDDNVGKYFDTVLDREAGDTMLVVVWPRVTLYRITRLLVLMFPRSVLRAIRKRTRLQSGAGNTAGLKQ
jgi:hypothetical protein